MAIFGSARQHFLDRFEPRGDGFTYRSTVHARAVPVTVEERGWMVRDFDDRRELVHILMFATPVAAILAGFLAYAASASPSVVAAAVWGTLFVFPSLLTFWAAAGRWRLLRRRPCVDDGLSKAEIVRRERAQTSWAGLLLRCVPSILWSSTIVMTAELNPIWRSLGGLFGIAVLAFMIREGYLKFGQDRQPRPVS